MVVVEDGGVSIYQSHCQSVLYRPAGVWVAGLFTSPQGLMECGQPREGGGREGRREVGREEGIW